MKTIHYILYVAFAALLFTACQEEDFGSGAKGGIRISLTEEVGVDVSTRSTPEELGKPMASQFKFKITDNTGATENYDYTDKVIPLSAGTYDVVAYCGDIATTVALDAPYYEGAAEATVEDGKTTNVKLSCKVANALLSIRINEDDKEKFEAAFETPSFQLTVGGKSVATSDITKSFYFPAGSTISKLAFSKDGSDYQELEGITWPSSIKAADHIIVTVGIEPAPSGVSLTVEKMKVETVTIKETIPMEWLPAPKIGYFNEQEGLTSIEYTESNNATPAKLNFSGSMAIEDIELGFEFGDTQYADWNSKTYNLTSISDEDKSALTQAGIVLPELGESTTGSIDFTNLTANLQVASGSATENKIKLRVKANNRWSSEEGKPSVYTIKTIAPKITVSAKPEDIWAKSLTVSGSEVESDNPTKITVTGYQYLDGAEWKDCTNGLAKLTDLPSEAKMQVRAVYREGVYAEPTEIELEEPTQLPNSDMEEWYNEEIEGSIRTYYPWSSSSTSFWNTNNDYTTRYRTWGSTEGYNCFPAVSYVSGRNGGKAAELRNTASGRGNTRFLGHTELDVNKVAGELFIGDIEVVTKGSAAIGSSIEDYYTITKGKGFEVRPTALQFYYKYNPYNGNDTWKVYFELLDENRETIISKEVTSSETKNDYGNTPMTVQFDYEEGKTYAKCKYIYIVFSSTINTGSSLPYGDVTYYLQENGESLQYSHVYVGSVLTIDDISLVYDK